MTKIVVTNDQDFSDEQKARLDALGDVTYFKSTPKDADEYLERVKGAGIICSGTAGLKDAYPQLRDVFVAVPFVSVAFLDLDVLKANNVAVANAPGANRYAVAEWILGMTIVLMRDLSNAINTSETLRKNNTLPDLTPGLAGHVMTVLGRGHVGALVGELAETFGMRVQFFARGDDLRETIKDADIVVDTLSSNPTTERMLDASFFDAMKQGSYFVTVTRSEILDEQALFGALDSGHLEGAAIDCGGVLVGDADDPYYRRFLDHPKVLATPHIAYNSEMSRQLGNDIMLDNIEAWINKRPQNIVGQYE